MLEYLKLNKVSKLLNVGVSTLFRFQKGNGFPIVQLGSHTHRVRRDSLEQWLKNQETKG
jgi:predicted DNA-binding transcriptional regulator AlpA